MAEKSKKSIRAIEFCVYHYTPPHLPPKKQISCNRISPDKYPEEFSASEGIISFSASKFSSFLFCSPPQRKLLAIYLHNDDSVLSNVFCSQMMCADSIVSYLGQNFITWAWDVTKEANKARYQNQPQGCVICQLCHVIF